MAVAEEVLNLVPLPFAPARLNGLSEKLLQSHWENNYGGSVRALNAVRSRLSRAKAALKTRLLELFPAQQRISA